MNLVGIGLIAAVLTSLIRRRRRATRPERRLYAPVYAAGVALLIAALGQLAAQTAGTPGGTLDVLFIICVIPLALVPYLVLGSFVRARVAQGGAVGELMVAGVRVLRHVRERLGHHEVRGRLDGLGQAPLRQLGVEPLVLHRERRRPAHRADARLGVERRVVDDRGDAVPATVGVTRDNGRVTVEVADDGVGGADPENGTGLRGLADRIAVLEGRLEIDSERGRGTTIRARIPCR